jgi:ABC-2 type transport system permease protein
MRRLRAESMLAIGLIGLAMVLSNLVAERWHSRFDLTADARHTLRPATLRLLEALDRPLEIRAYLPTHVQPPYSIVVQQMADILEEYQNVGEPHVKLTVVDPTDDALGADAQKRLRAEALGYGIKEADLQVTRADRQVRERVLFGVALLFDDRQAVVPPVQKPEMLEYALTRALRDVTTEQLRTPVIAWAEGHGEPKVLESPVAQVLASSGTQRAVRLDGPLVPAEVDVLVLLGPRRAYGPRARYVIDQFLMRGGSVVALLDYHQQSTAFADILVDTVSGLEPVLAAQGIRIQPKQAVVDSVENAMTPVGRDDDGRIITAHHPAHPRTRSLHAGHPITQGLSSLVVPFAPPIDARGAHERGHEVVVLAQGGATATVAQEARSPDPQRYQALPPSAEPPVLAVAVRGTFTSTFVGHSIPSRAAAAPGAPPSAPDRPWISAGEGEARLLLITSGARLLGADANGLLFLQNALDWASTATELISLRARAAEDPPLAPTTDASRQWVKLGNIIGAPLLLLVFGLLGRRRRRRRI